MSDATPPQDPFELFRRLWGPLGVPLPGMAMPTLDPNEIEKRIAELRSVEAWLSMNLNMVKFSIQGLEVQKAALLAMRGGEPKGNDPGQVFNFAHSGGANWRECVERCADRLGRPGAGLGFVYFTDALVDFSGEILGVLRDRTGVSEWVGTVGTGIVATGTEYQDEPAVAAMVADLDASSFGVFSGKIPMNKGAAHFAVVHADPQAPDVPGLVADMAARVASGYVVGGISSSRTRTVQVANDVVSGGLSGVALAPRVTVATRLTQGCSPFGPRYRITACEENVIATLDGRPALEVLLEATDEQLIRTGRILVGLPVAGSDTGDYVVRNLVGIDPRAKLVAIGEAVEPGDQIVFCRRDAAAAREDLARMLGSLREAAPRPRGALYFSCVARGEHMFGSRGAELQLLKDSLGEVPLVGFFCNGEICHDRLYGYTGVLTLFH